MAIFDSILKDEESLFLNELALSDDFIPKAIKFRESENQYIATCIKPLFKKRTGKNLLIFGPPGIGKTLAVKIVFKELEQTTDQIMPIYINTWKNNTAHKIILNICEQLNYSFTHNKTTSQLLQKISLMLNKKSTVICLDEIDKLLEKDMIYNLLENIYRKTLLLITNEKNFLASIDQRITSRLTPELLEFRPYSYQETFEILKQRAKYAFVPNVLTQKALTLIAQKTFKLKDIRSGLYLLKESALIAEEQSSRKILPKHTIKALEKFSNNVLKPDEEQILNLIKQNPNKTLKQIYDLSTKNISYSTFHRKIKNLEKLGKIKTKQLISRGKSTIINLTDF